MKEVSVYDAVGKVLIHDLTQIIPGEYKGSRFKKGHVIREEDIELLLKMGKKHLYVLEKGDTDIHENEAAIRIAKAATGKGIKLTEPSEGKVELIAEQDGLLKVNTDILAELIDQDEIMFATLHKDQVVRTG
ncbi:MAG: molybdopterin-binding protein, partial [Clostridiales bacterium]|nr:molybdopterin-binding protein [Clostridiales bacterium]